MRRHHPRKGPIMTDAQIATLTSNIFLAAWLGKHWLTGLMCIAYTVAALLK